MGFFNTLINGLKTWVLSQIRKVQAQVNEIEASISKAIDESVLTVTFTDSYGNLAAQYKGKVRSNKSFNEIAAAKDAGKKIEGVINFGGYSYQLFLTSDFRDGNNREFVFLTRTDDGYMMTVIVSRDSSAYAMIDFSTKITMGTAELEPGVSALRDGEIYLQYEED